MSKITAILNSAREVFEARIVNEIDNQAKWIAFNQAQTRKHNKGNQRKHENRRNKRPRT